MKIDYWPKPLPTRIFDWSATADDYEPGMPVGYGETCKEAIADLEEQIDEQDRRHSESDVRCAPRA